MEDIKQVMDKENTWLKKALEIESEIIKFRRQFHQIPELSLQEVKTSQKIKDILLNMGIECESCTKTGVVALLEGDSPGRVGGLRADIDAMPGEESTGLPFQSGHHEVIHSCGHDGHIAVVLGVAKLLKENSHLWQGKVKLIFQPGEELVKGAKRMIEEGVLKAPDLDYILGLHVWQPILAGEIGVKKNEIMASTENFKVIIKGQEAHGAMPHQGNDAISAGAEFISSIHHLLTRVINAENRYVLSFGKINGGHKGNVLPTQVEIEGTFRTFEVETAKIIKECIFKTLDNQKNVLGVDWDYQVDSCARPTYNDPDLTDKVLNSMKKIIPPDQIKMPYGPVFPSEDFSEYAAKIPGVFFFLGAGGEDYSYPHHHSKFDFDERALPLGTAIMLQAISDHNQ